MNKLLIGLIVALIAAGGVYYFMSSSPADTENEQSATTSEGTNATEAQQIDGTFTGSFQELVGRNGSFTCTFTHESDRAVSSGTIYVADDRVRGDFTTETQDMNAESHMIQKGGYMYTWSSMSPQGFKMAVPEGSDTADIEGEANTSGQYVSMDEEYEYQCESWTVDEAQFSLPDVPFVDTASYQK